MLFMFSAEYKLEDHRLAEHEISLLGTSVDTGNQGDQLPEPPAPLKEPSSKELKVLAGNKDPQEEVDKVKGSEVRTEQ